jgi:hypothetical protein
VEELLTADFVALLASMPSITGSHRLRLLAAWLHLVADVRCRSPSSSQACGGSRDGARCHPQEGERRPVRRHCGRVIETRGAGEAIGDSHLGAHLPGYVRHRRRRRQGCKQR